MPTNLIKKYDSHLEINHLPEDKRTISLKAIFDRDINNDKQITFRDKIIRPLKKDGDVDMEVLFSHLTNRTEDTYDDKGNVIKKRSVFDFERSKRLHWILPHLKENINGADIRVFSSNHRQNGRNIKRTFIHNLSKNYVIILEPQRSGSDYYFITAYYLEKKYGGHKTIKNKYKNKLPEIY
ncbi:hypothetical protein [Zunongwangia sp. HGR-M22]|uniref:hypothetical protein n=1 Tax=Zunongwangia sp. HGR-M22 TaxID=3015168 RepID=UPI0022DE0538|nr:hypothetical protein [Zunongwangia sp. HGR-M22]WBL25132.1 hypothetical protein PBT91_14660 [Zunongwangia sp. HGR-M22]